jgi:hypothetical protein
MGTTGLVVTPLDGEAGWDPASAGGMVLASSPDPAVSRSSLELLPPGSGVDPEPTGLLLREKALRQDEHLTRTDSVLDSSSLTAYSFLRPLVSDYSHPEHCIATSSRYA